jgi:hypothetical protein
MNKQALATNHSVVNSRPDKRSTSGISSQNIGIASARRQRRIPAKIHS